MKTKYKHITVRKEKCNYSCWSKHSKDRLGSFRTMGRYSFYECWGDGGDCDYQAALRRAGQWTDIVDFLGRLNSSTCEKEKGE